MKGRFRGKSSHKPGYRNIKVKPAGQNKWKHFVLYGTVDLKHC
jgi:hypothetical protein